MLVGPSGQPLGSPGGGGAGSTVAQLLRPGVDDQGNQVSPYQKFLSTLAEIEPTNEQGKRLFLTLVPDPEEAARQYPTPRAMKAEYDTGAEDPWGGRKPNLRIGADGAPVPPGPSTNPNAPHVVASSE